MSYDKDEITVIYGSNAQYKRDIRNGQENRQPRLPAGKHKIGMHEPKTMKQWQVVEGEADKCRICGTDKNVHRLRPLFNAPLCSDCKKKLLAGEIDPRKIVPKPKQVQPLDTHNTQSRGNGRVTKAMSNAKWIKCSCGRSFKTFPYKKLNGVCECEKPCSNPYRMHNPAFEKWVRHATGEQGHFIVDRSDRDPNGDNAVMSRLRDDPRGK